MLLYSEITLFLIFSIGFGPRIENVDWGTTEKVILLDLKILQPYKQVEIKQDTKYLERVLPLEWVVKEWHIGKIVN